MPAWGSALGENGVADVAEHVLRLSGRDHDAAAAERGAGFFAQYCATCHGPQGKGNPMLGAPDLTNDIWLYGGEPRDIARPYVKVVPALCQHSAICCARIVSTYWRPMCIACPWMGSNGQL